MPSRRPRPFWPALAALLRGEAGGGAVHQRLIAAAVFSLRHALDSSRHPSVDWFAELAYQQALTEAAYKDFGFVLDLPGTDEVLGRAARWLHAAAANPPPAGFPSFQVLSGVPVRTAVRKGPVALFVRGHLFELEASHLALPVSGLSEVLASCLARAPETNPLSPGLLSWTGPTRQGEWLRRWVRDGSMEQSLRFLERCAFAFVLEPDVRPATPYEAGEAAYLGNVSSRWFNFGVQLVVFGNGVCGGTMSHRLGLDGVPARSWASSVAKLLEGGGPVFPAESKGGVTCREHSWSREGLGEGWDVLSRQVESERKRRPGAHRVVRGLGRRFFQSQGCSADAAFQLAVFIWSLGEDTTPSPTLAQMVNLSNTYESGRIVRRGTIIQEFVDVAQALVDEVEPPVLRDLVLRASEAHREGVRSARANPMHLEYARLLTRRERRIPTELRKDGTLWVISSSLPVMTGVAGMGRFGLEAPGHWLSLHYAIAEDSLELLVTPGEHLDAFRGAESVAEGIFLALGELARALSPEVSVAESEAVRFAS